MPVPRGTGGLPLKQAVRRINRGANGLATEKTRQAYLMVIFSLRLILLGPTARILAKRADVAVLIIQSDRTCRAMVEKVVRVLQNFFQGIRGAVSRQI